MNERFGGNFVSARQGDHSSSPTGKRFGGIPLAHSTSTGPHRGPLSCIAAWPSTQRQPSVSGAAGVTVEETTEICNSDSRYIWLYGIFHPTAENAARL